MKLYGFVSGFQRFFSKERVMILAVFILLGMFLLWYSNGKTYVQDTMASSSYESGAVMTPTSSSEELPHPSEVFGKSGNESGNYAAKPIANPSDLLPTDTNSQWSSLNPMDHSSPELPDMLQAGYHIGLDSIGQTHKNANLQLRSDPIIPKANVGPWNNSTYEPDMLRQPLEIGCVSNN